MNFGKNLSLSLLLVILTLFCFFSTSLAAENKNNLANLFEQANRNYSEGSYTKAIEMYEALMASYGVSAPILYNLGNSYAQTSQPGRAVLSYLRALRLAPSNSDIKGNLQLIRKEHGLFQPEKTMTQQITHMLEIDQWCLATATALVLLTLLHLISFFYKLSTKWQSGLSILLVTCFLIFCFCGYNRYLDYHDGVVINTDVHLRISPFQSASSAGKLQEGRVVKPIQSHGDYSLVKDGSGRSGWLHKQDFELIVKRF